MGPDRNTDGVIVSDNASSTNYKPFATLSDDMRDSSTSNIAKSR